MQDDGQKMAEAKNLGLDPLMEKSASRLVKDIPKRLLALVNKFLGIETIFRVTAFGLATWLVYNGKISDYVWVIASAFLIFGKEALDTVEKIRR